MFESEEIKNDVMIQMHPSSDNSKVNAYAIIPAQQCCSTLESYPIKFINCNEDNNPVGSGDNNYSEMQFELEYSRNLIDDLRSDGIISHDQF